MRAAAAALAAVCLLAGCAGTTANTPIGPGWRQVGTASWYGGKYQGRTTASGDPFDKEQLTAAHPKLPFGTIARVRALDTGRTVEVRVNDRFGGHKGRVIDLSEAAFSRIAPTARGLVEVEVVVVSTGAR
ncbi:MAG: septal ring lytic transglycosylase RlpA family protein [Candidatus Sumerlaeia bacterium]|nr:septal ring lytic transglycosylase RlpA family protein [Candidatus Sumerlaeia bacterium]